MEEEYDSKSQFERNVEGALKRSLPGKLGLIPTDIDEIRAMPLDEFRARVEKAHGKPMRFYSAPFLKDGGSTDCDGSCSGLDTIGQRYLSSEEVDKQCSQAIKIPWHERVHRLYHKIFRR